MHIITEWIISQAKNVLPFNHHVTIHLIDMRIVHIQLIFIQ